ncbi:Thioesterase-like superfamily protein [Tranquillimonas rosea]|uniref:Thioesterase-like superfamily protein n=1 Tax=Tranquillimonas rosea TaxID=641238 RepID=A0A1H9UAT5_9RHOB|nr:acyl-CoA thioesterase [Tranquillimonas rosea]SES06358.1 Thioesterase-like superfamily protein [Tranquillimonas rosea]
MYPVARLAKEAFVHRKAPTLGLFETHVSHHLCWPHDIDVWMELNNGRTLTLYDLGRLVLFRRIGLVDLMRRERWAGTVAGASVRYRRRVRMFDRIEMRSRLIGWDERFFYLEQGMWVRGICTSHVLLRTAVTDRTGMLPTARVAEVAGMPPDSPALPEWVHAWGAADATRPWPPEID